MNLSCKNNFCLQRSSLQKSDNTSALVFPAQLDKHLEAHAESLTDDARYMTVLNILYSQQSGALITKATLAEGDEITPRVSDSFIAN